MTDLYKRDEFGLNVTGAQPAPSNPAQDYSDSLNVLSKTILKESAYGNAEQNWKGDDTGTLAQGKPYRDPQTSSYMARAYDRAQNGSKSDIRRVNNYEARMNRRDRNGAEGGANIPTSGNSNNIPVSGPFHNSFAGLDEWKGYQRDYSSANVQIRSPRTAEQENRIAAAQARIPAPLGNPLVAASSPTPLANPDDWKDYQPVGQFAVRSGNNIFSRYGNASTNPSAVGNRSVFDNNPAIRMPSSPPSQAVAGNNFVDDLFGRKKSL